MSCLTEPTITTHVKDPKQKASEFRQSLRSGMRVGVRETSTFPEVSPNDSFKPLHASAELSLVLCNTVIPVSPDPQVFVRSRFNVPEVKNTQRAVVLRVWVNFPCGVRQTHHCRKEISFGHPHCRETQLTVWNVKNSAVARCSNSNRFQDLSYSDGSSDVKTALEKRKPVGCISVTLHPATHSVPPSRQICEWKPRVDHNEDSIWFMSVQDLWRSGVPSDPIVDPIITLWETRMSNQEGIISEISRLKGVFPHMVI